MIEFFSPFFRFGWKPGIMTNPNAHDRIHKPPGWARPNLLHTPRKHVRWYGTCEYAAAGTRVSFFLTRVITIAS